MANLISPGTSITFTDESLYATGGAGTVPLIFIATAENKTDASGTSIAYGTLKENAGKLFAITSTRDLLSTFGTPKFYSVSGTQVNGYPLNEYGLLAAHSYLGGSNLAYVVRGDIDLGQLEPTTVEPSSPVAPGTMWFDTKGTSFGIFKRTGIAPNEVWTAVDPKVVRSFPSGTTNSPEMNSGNDGDFAVTFQTQDSTISYWVKVNGAWVRLGDAGENVVIQTVWPDLETSDAKYWIKASSPAKGANLVIRRMDATTGQFVQLEAPILADDNAADAYYSAEANGSLGQIYVAPVSVSNETGANSFRIMEGQAGSGLWAAKTGIIGSNNAPRGGPENGRLWFNSLVGLDSDGNSTIDILVADGQGAWQNINLPGFDDLSVQANRPTLYTQPADPRDNTPAPVMKSGDIWVKTSGTPYPIIYRWSANAWLLVENDDQVTPNGIVFADARPNPMFMSGTYTGMNNNGGNNPDLDFDAPNADLYPRGFLLWNTRYSTNNVKRWVSPYEVNGQCAQADDTNGGSLGRWVSASGTTPSGVPLMGENAQQVVIAAAIEEAIINNEDIRSESLSFNLIAAPGQLEVHDAMLSLNLDRKLTAFVIGDSPFKLDARGTSLQAWATNRYGANGDSLEGLVTSSSYFGVYYPSSCVTANTDGTEVVMPSSHIALRTIAYSDQVSYVWFPPAGLQRGSVQNATAVGYVDVSGKFVNVSLNEGQRNILYENGINPIRVMPRGGINVFGQKTRQNFASAKDRINVVRLENHLRKVFDELAQPFLFELNDSLTRKSVKAAYDKVLGEIVTLRGIYDFLVICDESNNTPARIDRNELWIDIAIQPAKSIEFIYIPVRIVNTGTSLE